MPPGGRGEIGGNVFVGHPTHETQAGETKAVSLLRVRGIALTDEAFRFSDLTLSTFQLNRRFRKNSAVR